NAKMARKGKTFFAGRVGQRPNLSSGLARYSNPEALAAPGAGGARHALCRRRRQPPTGPARRPPRRDFGRAPHTPSTPARWLARNRSASAPGPDRPDIADIPPRSSLPEDRRRAARRPAAWTETGRDAVVCGDRASG